MLNPGCDRDWPFAAHHDAPASGATPWDSGRSTFPADYLSAEWWHFQNEEVLVPGISQFGVELLSVAGRQESDLQEEPRI